MSDENDDVQDAEDLEINSIIAFDGATVKGFKTHPDGEHVVFPIGNKVSILNWTTKKQYFLAGHTNIISALDLSRDGKLIASGQINHIGFRALLIIWDFETRTKLYEHEIHKVRVEAILFSVNSRFLMSLGGRDCGNVVVFDTSINQPLCGSKASPDSAGETTVLEATNRRPECFVTGGDNTLRVWTIDENARAVSKVDVNLSKIKRNFLSITIDPRDEYAYCGTTTGDIVKVKLNFDHKIEIIKPIKTPSMIGCFGKIDPRLKRNPDVNVLRYKKGVSCMYLLADNTLIIGSGSGEVELVKECDKKECESAEKYTLKIVQPTKPRLLALQRTNVNAAVTSICVKNKDTIFVCTSFSEMYSINLNNFKDMKLLMTCHTSSIYDITFPHNFSEVFATASKEDIRVWSLKTKQELLRIKVPNFSCSSIKFTYDGTAILSGWNDGIIRAFTPITGKLLFSILNSHNKGVSALAVTSDDKRIVSGGCEGQVRIWSLGKQKRDLIQVLKEHKGPITRVGINKYNTEVVSSSSDGSCIVWDIVRMCRKQIFIGNTLFMCVKYHPSSVQILTGGSDRKIAYWEVFDGSLIREVEGSISEAINALDISSDGSYFLTGGNDQIIKLWRYDEGYTTHIGTGHAGVISAVVFSPDNRYIISASGSGDIFIWNSPFVSCNINTQPRNGSGDQSEVKSPSKQKSSSIISEKRQPMFEEINNINSKPGDQESIKTEIQQSAIGDPDAGKIKKKICCECQNRP